jgi:hypothetical protein
MARQGADVAVLKGTLWPQGDLDGLFAVGGHGRDVGAFDGNVDDPEPDFRLGAGRASMSRTVTLGGPFLFRGAADTSRDSRGCLSSDGAPGQRPGDRGSIASL